MNLEEYKGVFVFAQQVDNKLSGIAFELLGKAKDLAKDLNTDCLLYTSFGAFTSLIAGALKKLKVPACVNGRNDILADGKKISGNAQYVKQNRIMHHGTLMFRSDLETLTPVSYTHLFIPDFK